MILKNGFLHIVIFAFCFQLYSCSNQVRTFAPFSESTPALEEGDEVQIAGTVNLMRGEVNASAAVVNHWAVSANAGVRMPLTAKWYCSDLKAGVGYYNNIREDGGFEIFAGYGKIHFENLRDTIKSIDFNWRSEVKNYVRTTINYHSFYLKPDIWVRSGSSKFIFSVGLQYLYTPRYNYYQQKFREYFEDSSTTIDFIKQYNGEANILLLEPAFQFRTGEGLQFFAEVKLLTVLKEDIAKDIYFNSPKSVVSVGLLYNFRKRKQEQPDTAPTN